MKTEETTYKTKRNFIWLLAGLTFIGLLTLMMQPLAFAAEGKLVYDTVHSPALEGNLLGDSPDRPVTIYLPPSYDTQPDQRYPVVYLLHGAGASNSDWTGGYLGNIKVMMDRLVDATSLQEMILVMPSAQTRYITAWYTNSPVAGNWEDFITHDLVQYIDDTYRTLAQAGSRGIGGHSVGGAEALRLATKFPKVFSSVYGLSSSPMDFNHATDFSQNGAWIQLVSAVSLGDTNRFGGIGAFAKWYFAGAASFSPNPDNPPFFVDLPFELVDGRLERIEPIWGKWLEHDPVAMVDSYETNLLELSAIHFDCGTSDSVLSDSRAFDAALTSLGIPHVYEEYPGTHTSGIPQRIETKVLPFFSDTLAFEMLLATAVQPRGKLSTTWGEVKRNK